MPALDVLIPTCDRPTALAVTLTSLTSQTFSDFRIVVSDQSADEDDMRHPVLLAALRVLALRRHVEVHRHMPRRGMAEHRQSLLDRATAPAVLFLDDDVICEPTLLERLHGALRRARCGFVGSAVVGLSYEHDERPHEQHIELWEEPVRPERVVPGSPEWARHRVHNAANLLHVARHLRPEGDLLYKVAWIGGCVMYDTEALRDAGGFEFWPLLPPEHAGEDALAQLRVMARFGGCGLLPSGAYHQELETTVRNRRVDAPFALRHLLDDPRRSGRVAARRRPDAVPVGADGRRNA